LKNKRDRQGWMINQHANQWPEEKMKPVAQHDERSTMNGHPN
jgi:hypothetical protein